jgi:decaprenylphospho-beta-D-erythro-pentofuranosid-2-ulose 2-reductase
VSGHIVVVGGTSRIAHLCLRQWAETGAPQVSLLGRNAERLAAIASDLVGRNREASVDVIQQDLTDLAAIPAVIDRISSSRPPTIALVAHGYLPSSPVAEQTIQELAETLTVTGCSAALYAEHLARAMQHDGGQLGIIGSVASDRGRRQNYPYGAAKSMLAHYSQGLQHRYWRTPLSVTLIKPGPTDTPMTAGVPSATGRLADPHDVASAIVRSMAKGKRLAYTPAVWGTLMLIIRSLPRPVFDRLNL